MRRAVYDREAEEIPVGRLDVARRAETVIARRHSAEPLTPVQPVGGVKRYPSSGRLRRFSRRLVRCLTVCGATSNL
jgi:hypothetical protein